MLVSAALVVVGLLTCFWWKTSGRTRGASQEKRVWRELHHQMGEKLLEIPTEEWTEASGLHIPRPSFEMMGMVIGGETDGRKATARHATGTIFVIDRFYEPSRERDGFTTSPAIEEFRLFVDGVKVDCDEKAIRTVFRRLDARAAPKKREAERQAREDSERRQIEAVRRKQSEYRDRLRKL